MKKLFIFLLLMTLGVNNSYADPAAKRVRTDVSNFGTNLSSADTTVQKALETLDDMALGSGSAIILDLADDGSNESTDLGEIAITNDTNSIFSEPTADKFLIDVSKNWPIADVSDSASAGDAALDFFGAGVTAVTNADACTNIAGTGLSISGGTLNWSASGIAGHDSFSDFVANEHLDWTSDQGATNIHSGNYPITGYIKADGTVPLTANWPAGAFGISGLTYLETDELYNSGGDLKIMPDVQGDTIFYGDTDVGDDAHGKKHTIKRMAAEGDNQIQFYIDATRTAVLSTDTMYTALGNPAAGKYAYTGNFYTYISGGNPIFQQYGNIGAVGMKYIQQQVNDATDYFELTREDANILGFDIQMPLSVTDPTGVVIGEDVAGGSSNEEGIIKLWSNGDNAFYSKFSTGTQTEIVEYILPLAKGTAGQVMEVASVAGNVVTMEWDTDDSGGAPEGTAVLSTGEGGGTKFLREDGDGTCSWQAAGGGATALDDIGDPDAATSISMDDNEAITLTSAEDTGTVLTINITDNDLVGETTGIDIKHAMDGSNLITYLRCYDNAGNDLVFDLGANGNTELGALTARTLSNIIGGLQLGTATSVAGNLTMFDAGTLTMHDNADDFNITLQVNDGEAVMTLTGGLDISGVLTTTSPVLTTPALGTPSALVGTNISGTGASFTAGTVTNATLTTALTVDTGTLTLTANGANNSVLTVGAGASSVSGANTGDNTVATTGDSATAFFGEGTIEKERLPDASTTADGVVELAIASEVNTGTSAVLAVTPDSLAGSIHGKEKVYVKVMAYDTAVATGDGKAYFTVTSDLNGMNLVDADVAIYTASSSGNPSWQIHNLTDTTDMLSTNITIDAGSELNSYTAATPPVINAAEDDVVTGDVLRIDCDVSGTGSKGSDVILVFQTP